MARRWRRFECAVTGCETTGAPGGAWGTVHASVINPGKFYAEAFAPGERVRSWPATYTEAAAKRVVSRWLDQHAARPKRKRGGR